jgi:dTDP-4-amino-4,6-dideoxygalactose transaminase
LGINGKISELQAAMGLAVFPHMKTILEGRKIVVDYYNEHLDFSKLSKIKLRDKTQWNYSYYPVIFETEEALLQIQTTLNKQQIFPRRYFYPSLNSIEFTRGGQLIHSDNISSKILCLPLFVSLNSIDLKLVINIINNELL